MITLCFKDVFNDYDKFKEFTNQFNLYKESDTIAETINKRIFYCLYNRYLGCSIAYETVDEFIAEFGICYQQYFTQILEREKILKEIHKLNMEDFEILAESQSNFSNNPNSLNTDPFELLTYTTNQQRGRTKSGKLQAYLNALRSLPDMQIDLMIKKFDYLWLDILETQNEYLY